MLFTILTGIALSNSQATSTKIFRASLELMNRSFFPTTTRSVPSKRIPGHSPREEDVSLYPLPVPSLRSMPWTFAVFHPA